MQRSWQTIALAETLMGGRVLLVHLPHARAAVVADRLALASEPPPANLVVCSPGEINVYGDGRVIAALRDRAPSGWSGGDLPEAGFWGTAGAKAQLAPVLGIIAEVFQADLRG